MEKWKTGGREPRGVADICASAVALLLTVGNFTAEPGGEYVRATAQELERELQAALAADPLAAALDRITELEAELGMAQGRAVELESMMGHMRQAAEILGERLADPPEAPEPEPAALPLIVQEGTAPAQVVGSGGAGSFPGSTGRSARRFRLFEVMDGADTGYSDEGTAAELANRNGIGPSTVYRLAKSGAPRGRWRVEEVA